MKSPDPNRPSGQSRQSRPSLAEQFQEFDEMNPHVYDAFVESAKAIMARGFDMIGIHLILNHIRWEILMKTEDPNSEFKINTNYSPFYERKLIVNRVVPVGFFETRKSQADQYDYFNGCPSEADWYNDWLRCCQ